ncbi:hypothetical protein BT63DRAFT_21320 [Microthyrium microscopicum]|uniref:Uncharacterized protein n=1 Tax=Microthyrium microscopicum TaxID=703497 RepID=A0A6A6URB9_9PEZI|nr:hypothetical protein BT63DRAFT_21320 [Microthyrium microscopicum]
MGRLHMAPYNTVLTSVSKENQTTMPVQSTLASSHAQNSVSLGSAIPPELFPTQDTSDQYIDTYLDPIPPLTNWQIWDAVGNHRVMFAGSSHIVYTFFPNDGVLNQLQIFKRLRERGVPERWSDLEGNGVGSGKIQPPIRPQVNSGPTLAGRVLGLPDNAMHVIIRKAMLQDVKIGFHVPGDPVYQFIRYPSRYQAEMGMVETLSLGYSLVACWAEVDPNAVDTDVFLGEQLLDERVFAVVDRKQSPQDGF